MNDVDLSNAAPVLEVEEVERLLAQLSPQVSLPSAGILRGEVVSSSGNGQELRLRGAGRATIEVRLGQPLEVRRGDVVEVTGAPELVASAVPVGLRLVWRGSAAENRGESPSFQARRTFAEAQTAKLPFTTPRIDARLRGGRVRVVTERDSKAWADAEEAARQYRWLKLDARYCEDLRDPARLAPVLTSLLPVVSSNDVVLIAGGGGDLADLDVFEDERVVGALVRLTMRCATILAVGHPGEELMTNKLVTYPIDTAQAALQLLLRESGEPPAEPQRTAPEPDAREHAPVVANRSNGLLVRLLLLGAAASLGWLARGFFQDGADQQTSSRQSLAPVHDDRR